MSRINCVPSFTNPFTETRKFVWNVSGYVRKNDGSIPAMSFSYYVGEGPLYWFRIEWHFRSCPPNPCIETTPIISYIMGKPNCPYEIIENCTIKLPSICPKDPCCCQPCCQKVEIWHMLATSVTHLCERINQECCNPKPRPNFFITRVQQYMKPALCCDVQAIGGTDDYTDVDFVKCECGNLIDPCKAVVVYPCHVNRCGINGPAFSDGPVPPISVVKFAPDLLDFQPVAFAAEVSPTKPLEFKEVSPSVVKKFGSPISEMIHCEHNLGEASVLKDYLKLNNISFDSMNLFYNRGQNIWQGSKDFRDWWVSMEWSPLEKRGYKLNIAVTQRNGSTKRTKADFIVKSDNIISDRNNLDVNLNFNPSTGIVTAKNGTLQSKLIKDDVGLFSKCKNLVFNLKG